MHYRAVNENGNVYLYDKKPLGPVSWYWAIPKGTTAMWVGKTKPYKDWKNSLKEVDLDHLIPGGGL